MEQFSLLTPGSVWTRERKGRQIFSTVVCVTNTHLPDHIQEQYPPQVVYLDQKGRFNNITVERFLSNRSYYDTDPAVAMNVENIFGTDEESETQFVEVSEDELVAGMGEAAETEQETSAGDQQLVDEVPVTFFVEDAETPPAISLDLLSQSLVAYQQRPVPEADTVQHELTFELSDQLTIEQLRGAFSGGGNPVTSFIIGGQLIEWELFLGGYPMFTAGSAYAIAVFRTHANYAGLDDLPEEEIAEPEAESEVAQAPVTEQPEVAQTPEAPAVEQTAEVQPEPAAVPATVSTMAANVASSIIN